MLNAEVKSVRSRRSVTECSYFSIRHSTFGHDHVFPRSLRLSLPPAARVETRSDRLVLCDLSGLERLFGDAQALGVALGRAAVRRGLAPRVAVAETRVAAWLMACARPGPTVGRPGTEAAALAPLPVEALGALAEAEDAPSAGVRPRRRADRRRGAASRHDRLAPAPSDVATGVSRPGVATGG